MLVVRLPPLMEKKLNEIAKKTGRTKSLYVRQLLESKIDELEERYGCHLVKTPDTASQNQKTPKTSE